MSLPIRYGRPKTASKKTMNGFLLGRGGFGLFGSIGAVPPEAKAKKLEGVREVASAGGGRPVRRARRVRVQRRSV